MGFPGGSGSKESAYNAEDLGLIPGSGRSPGEGMATHSSILSCLEENPHGLRSLVGYSPRGSKEWDMTEHVTLSKQCSVGRKDIKDSNFQK